MADYPVTLSKTRISTLSNQERLKGFTHRFKVKYSDVAVASATANADTVTVTLGTTPTRFSINAAQAVVTTAFAGTTALTMQVGITSNTDSCIVDTTVKTAGPICGLSNAVAAASKGSAASDIVAVFTNATGGSPSAISAGEVDIYLAIQNLDQLG